MSWLVVKHGLMRCDQAQSGALRGELFWKAIELAQKEGYDIKLKRETAEIDKDVSKYFEGKPPHFVPAYLAEELLEKFHYLTRESDRTIFFYRSNEGVYTPNGKAHIKRHVKRALGKHLRVNRQNEVINYIKCSALQKVEETPPHMIALKNGILNLKTGELEKFDPKYFVLNALPVQYDLEAKYYKIEEFAKSIVKEDDTIILQEIAGYCLWRSYFIHKAVMFIGEGANGKSTFMELLRAMLGNENVSTLPLQALDERNRFALVSLYGKLANNYPDLSDQALRNTGTFKMLVGGDTISGEYKFKDRFSFKNYAKLVFSANKIPITKDDTTAFFRRWVIINFPYQFTDDNPKTDKSILQRLATEENLSGLLNWALEGLKRVLKNGRFSNTRGVEETREQYIRASDSVKAFVIDRVRHAAGNIVPKSRMYQLFIEYCQENSLPTVAKNSFAMKIPEHVPNIRTAKKRIGGKLVTCWGDVRVDLYDPSESGMYH